MRWVASLKPPHHIDGEARLFALLEVANPDPGVFRHPCRFRNACLKWRHVLGAFFVRIAGRDQPPDLIQTQGRHRIEADTPMPGMGGSTPCVWGDRIFLTSEEGDEIVFLCVSTQGKELWKRKLGVGGGPRFMRGEGDSMTAGSISSS